MKCLCEEIVQQKKSNDHEEEEMLKCLRGGMAALDGS